MRQSKCHAAIALPLVKLIIAAYGVLADKSRAAGKRASARARAGASLKESNR
jgi:hypothetical protein